MGFSEPLHSQDKLCMALQNGMQQFHCSVIIVVWRGVPLKKCKEREKKLSGRMLYMTWPLYIFELVGGFWTLGQIILKRAHLMDTTPSASTFLLLFKTVLSYCLGSTGAQLAETDSGMLFINRCSLPRLSCTIHSQYSPLAGIHDLSNNHSTPQQKGQDSCFLLLQPFLM